MNQEIFLEGQQKVEPGRKRKHELKSELEAAHEKKEKLNL